MSLKHTVLVSIDEPFAPSLNEGRLQALARRVLEAEGAEPCELSVTVTDDETVRGLNREYAGEDAATDVLSFSQREGEEFASPPEALPQLGEVVIAYPYAARQARARPSTLRLGSGQAGSGREGRSGALRQAQDERTRSDARAHSAHGGPPVGEGEWGVEREIEWLLVHGVLHLLGYDHAEAEEERRMRSREVELLAPSDR